MADSEESVALLILEKSGYAGLPAARLVPRARRLVFRLASGGAAAQKCHADQGNCEEKKTKDRRCFHGHS